MMDIYRNFRSSMSYQNQLDYITSRYITKRSLKIAGLLTISLFCSLFFIQNHLLKFIAQEPNWLCQDWITDRIRYAIWPLDYTPRGNLTNMRRLYRDYLKLVETPTFRCDKRVRYGNKEDGGWDLCDEPPYSIKPPCLVHSWGINWDFSFDDSISKDGGCQVYAFDPSMGTRSFDRSERLHFYSFGIKGTSINEETSWDLRTYDETLRFLGQERTTIDFLKMDVEGAEWAPLNSMAVHGGILQNVRQMALEVHVFRDVTESDLNRIVSTLRRLEELGFKLYETERNICGMRIVHRNFILGHFETCCHNVYYVNTKYKRP